MENDTDLTECLPFVYKEISFLDKKEQNSLINTIALLKNDTLRMNFFKLKIRDYRESEKKICTEYFFIYTWLFNHLVETKTQDILSNTVGSGYFFFDGLDKDFNPEFTKKITYENVNYSIEKYFLFDNPLLLLQNDHFNRLDMPLYKDTSKKYHTLHKNLVRFRYKIHLMPTKETFLKTLYVLCKSLHKNPLIDKKRKLKDFISSFKVVVNPRKDHKNLPLIVIYIPNVFIDSAKIDTINSPEDLVSCIDYKKSKECTNTLLTYLVWLFNQKENQDCMGSETVPRYNQQVTNLIFFAQGDGDYKEDGTFKDFFEQPDMIYFKAEEGEDFKIDSAKVIEDAERLDSNNINIPMPLVEEISQNKGKNISNDNSGPQNIATTENQDLKSKEIVPTIASNITMQQNTTSTQSNQSSIVNTSRQSIEPESPSTWKSIARFFKSILYTIFQWLNFGW